MRLFCVLLLTFVCTGCATRSAQSGPPVTIPPNAEATARFAVIQLCLSVDGAVERVQLQQSSGDADFDSRVLEKLRNHKAAPLPAGMPPCLQVKIEASPDDDESRAQ